MQPSAVCPALVPERCFDGGNGGLDLDEALGAPRRFGVLEQVAGEDADDTVSWSDGALAAEALDAGKCRRRGGLAADAHAVDGAFGGHQLFVADLGDDAIRIADG